MSDNNSIAKTIIVLTVIVAIIVGGFFLVKPNNFIQDKKDDPEGILGQTLKEVSKKFCSGTNTKYNEFHISNRIFTCYDFGELFINSDFDNYLLSSYNYSTYTGSGSFYFDINKTQTDLRPLTIDDPQQFVGGMATALCPKYSLANFKIYVSGEHIGTSTIPCKDINQYGMYQDVIITNAYYGADTENGDNPNEYFKQNNTKGTRKLYFVGEYIKNRKHK